MAGRGLTRTSSAPAHNRVAVRRPKLAVGYPLGADEVAVVVGMSVTDTCQSPGAYRVVSATIRPMPILFSFADRQGGKSVEASG